MAIVVTGSRIRHRQSDVGQSDHRDRRAEQEELGDLKLYRIPEPVTVAANARSRSPCCRRAGSRSSRSTPPAMLARPADRRARGSGRPARTRNGKERGSGCRCRRGRWRSSSRSAAGGCWSAEGAIADSAVGEEVEIGSARAPDRRPASLRAEAERATRATRRGG